MSVDPSDARERMTSGVLVRRPGRDDLSAIMEISNWAILHTAAIFRSDPEGLDYWVDLWERQADRYAWFVAELEGEVIGFAKASPFVGRCGYAYTAEVTIYVNPEHHGKQVGLALYSRLIPTLRAQGFRTLVAVIAVPNPASERLHAKFGFERTGTLRRVGWKSGKWHDVAYWQLALCEGDSTPDPLRSVSEVAQGDGLED